jgi:molybdate transport system substrate-binding protein
LLALACASLVSACGGSSSNSNRLLVFAAASLREPFTLYARQLPRHTVARYSFAGSDTLAAQIEQGVHPDVFASANTKLPDALYAKGLVEKPVVFAANKLVLAVPRSSKVTGLSGVERPGVSIAIGSPTVPVGSYTQKLIGRLPAGERGRLLANVRDREPDVTGIVGKLTQGAVDAGFLYASDVTAAGGELRAIELPASLQPLIAYGAAVVKGSPHATRARSFVTGLLHGVGRMELLQSGFLPPPG